MGRRATELKEIFSHASRAARVINTSAVFYNGNREVDHEKNRSLPSKKDKPGVLSGFTGDELVDASGLALVSACI